MGLVYIDWFLNGNSAGPSAVASSEQVGTPTKLAQGVKPRGISTTEAFGQPAIKTGVVVRIIAGTSSAETFGRPSTTSGIATVAIRAVATAEAFGQPKANITVPVRGVASGEGFGRPTTTSGGVVHVLVGISSGEAVGRPTLNVRVPIGGIPTAEAFGQPRLNVRVPIGFVPTAETFGQLSVQVGAVVTAIAGIGSREALGQPRFSVTVPIGGVPTAEAVGWVTTSVVVPIGFVATTEAFGQPLPILGAVGISTQGIGSAEAFGQPAFYELVIVAVSGAATAEAAGNPTVFVTPRNDKLANAIDAVDGFGLGRVGTLIGASVEPGEPNVTADRRSVWWKWRAPANGQINISSAGSDFNTLLTVYRSDLSVPSFGDLQQVVQDEAELVDVVVSKDLWYFLQVQQAD